MGGQDPEGAGQRGHVHLLHIGAVVKHLDGEDRDHGNRQRRGRTEVAPEPWRDGVGRVLRPEGPALLKCDTQRGVTRTA